MWNERHGPPPQVNPMVGGAGAFRGASPRKTLWMYTPSPSPTSAVLPSILKHPEAGKKFETGNKNAALADAKKLVEAGEPEHGSDFFKLLAKLPRPPSISSAAHNAQKRAASSGPFFC